METLFINGKRELRGSLDIVSAKNALLPILAGCILSKEDVVIKKVAKFSDVMYMTKILESLGSSVKIEDETLIINSSLADKFLVKEEFTQKVRSSVFMLGPLLARFKKVL